MENLNTYAGYDVTAIVTSRIANLTPVLVVCLMVAAAVASGIPATASVAQSDDYEISIDGSITVPERTVTVDGDSYTVDALATREPGDQLTVDVDAPAGQEYDLYLYNRQVQIEQTEPMNGSGTAEFVTDDLRPSTYFVAVYLDGKIQKIHPLVISGYDLSTDAPSTATRGETVNVSVDVTRTDERMSDPPRRIQVILGNQTASLRVNASEQDGTYVAQVPTESLSPGEYATYSVVRGENETEGGEKEVLGVSARQDLTVESTSTPTPTPTDTSDDSDSTNGGSSGEDSTGDSGGSTGGGGSTGDSTTATATPTATPTPSNATATSTPTSTSTSTPTVTPTSASPTATETLHPPTVTPTPTVSPTPTEEDVITPATTTSDDPGTMTTSDGQPGFGAVAGAVALLAGSLLLTRRRREN